MRRLSLKSTDFGVDPNLKNQPIPQPLVLTLSNSLFVMGLLREILNGERGKLTQSQLSANQHRLPIKLSQSCILVAGFIVRT